MQTLNKVSIQTKSIKDYKTIIPEEQYESIIKLGKELSGKKVTHINATPDGGGPAEILKRLVPLMCDVGIDASWYTIPPKEEFMKVLLTKKIHLALQGGHKGLTEEEKQSYIKSSQTLASLADDIQTDFWILHDPQPLGAGHFLKNKTTPKALHIHIDLSKPHEQTWKFLMPYITSYDAAIFQMNEFIPPEFPEKKAVAFPVAIDPLSPQNKKIDTMEAKKTIAQFGIDPEWPLLVNISRFDMLKDPIGMVDAYRKAKEKIPNLQFALSGLMLADDDPEAKEVLKEVQRHSNNDVFLFSDPKSLNMEVDDFVRALQSAADVIIHKSIYEGFGMAVTEALLRGKPVVAGNVGGLKLQIQDGENGFLVNSVDEAADRIVRLFEDQALRHRMGDAAEKSTKENFLTPRLLLDYLKLIKSHLL